MADISTVYLSNVYNGMTQSSLSKVSLNSSDSRSWAKAGKSSPRAVPTKMRLPEASHSDSEATRKMKRYHESFSLDICKFAADRHIKHSQ